MQKLDILYAAWLVSAPHQRISISVTLIDVGVFSGIERTLAYFKRIIPLLVQDLPRNLQADIKEFYQYRTHTIFLQILLVLRQTLDASRRSDWRELSLPYLAA